MPRLGHKSFFYLVGNAGDFAIVKVAHGAQRDGNREAWVKGLRATKRLRKVDPIAEQTIEIEIVLGLTSHPDDLEFLDGEIDGRRQTHQVIFAYSRNADATESQSAEKGNLHFPVRRGREDR